MSSFTRFMKYFTSAPCNEPGLTFKSDFKHKRARSTAAISYCARFG